MPDTEARALPAPESQQQPWVATATVISIFTDDKTETQMNRLPDDARCIQYFPKSPVVDLTPDDSWGMGIEL